MNENLVVDGTFSSCVVGCDATSVVVGASCVEETVYEAEDESAEPAQQLP